MARKIELHRSFVRSYRKRISKRPTVKAQYEKRVALFLMGVRHAPLNDHALKGTKAGQRAFSITADVRVIYIETDTSYIFLDIGTHNQVYDG